MPAELHNEDIYEAALDSEAMGRLPALLAQVCNGRSALIGWFGANGIPDILEYSYFSNDMMRQYANVFHQHDMWATTAFSRNYINDIAKGDCEIEDNQFEKSILFNEFFRKNGDDTFYCVGGAQLTRWGTALVGVHRNRRAGSFTDVEAERLREIVRHLRGSLTLRGRLANEQRHAQTSQAAWDTTTLAAIVVRADGRIVQHNAAAETALRRAQGLKAANNVLRATAFEAQRRLQRAIGVATAPRAPSASSIRIESQDGVAYLLSVTPMSLRSGPSLALVTFKDPLASQDPLHLQLQQIWGLTAHEALVAAELAQGRDICQIAEARGVLESTVKSQLKAISAKMGAHSQRELVAKMRMLP